VKKTKKITTSKNYKSKLLPPPLTKINAGKSISTPLPPFTLPLKNATKREKPTPLPTKEEMMKTKFWMKSSESSLKKFPPWTIKSEIELMTTSMKTLLKEFETDQVLITI